MKYNKMIFGVVAVFFLFLLMPHWLCADTTSELADSRQTEEARGPQTPEELLQVIKALFSGPDADGQEFIEQQFGFEGTDWGKPLPTGEIRKGIPSPRINYYPFPFHFEAVGLDRQNKLFTLEISFYRNPNFRITPDLTRKILGQPTKIYVSSPKNENSTGVYKVKYRYETEKYYFDIVFMNRDENSEETRSAFRHHTPEQIQNEKVRRQSFEIHKDYLALAMELKRFEHPRFKKQ